MNGVVFKHVFVLTEGKKIRTILTLPYLFKTVTAAKKGKNKTWRPSRAEVAESLLLHVKVCSIYLLFILCDILVSFLVIVLFISDTWRY